MANGRPTQNPWQQVMILSPRTAARGSIISMMPSLAWSSAGAAAAALVKKEYLR
ncbi:MAG: hypothetical protein JRN37_08260 [Nitrososphaerota archaeon]|nr:hypothetical protein [Nitrososphaerota archaeon]MDG7039124.1 hypothetical protein [Nitrososphaerota archaeon]